MPLKKQGLRPRDYPSPADYMDYGGYYDPMDYGAPFDLDFDGPMYEEESQDPPGAPQFTGPLIFDLRMGEQERLRSL